MYNTVATLHALRDSLAMAGLERIPPYLGQQRSALLEWFAQPQGAMSDPLVEFDPPFAPADLTWEEVVQAGLLHKKTLELLKRAGTIKSTCPYQHQFEAIQAARLGQSIVVSAGTGSGKTECFLIPILDDLVREALATGRALTGLRSMLIYPLNALVFDQMGRWRAVLRHQREVLGFVPIRLSMYNAFLKRGSEVGRDLRPTLQALDLPEDDPDLRPYLPLVEGEVTRREQLLAGGDTGANLLITNYVMLELAQLREADQTWLNEATGWKHLVLDEAHTYSGGLAVDLALLLRRLRDRINPLQVPQGFATSATFGGQNAQADLSAFCSVLFHQDPAAIRVLEGHRVEVAPDPAAPSELGEAYPRLVRFLQEHQDPARLRSLIFPQSILERQIFPGQGDAKSQLAGLLAACGDRRGSDGVRALLPHRLHAVLRRPIPWPSQCVNPDCRGRGRQVGYRRWPALGWIGQDPSDDRCPWCQGPMLLPVTCAYEGCAQEGLLGLAIYQGFPPRLTQLLHPWAQSAVPGSLSLLVAREDWPLDLNATPLTLDHGQVRPASDSEAPWRLLEVGGEHAEQALCPRCQHESTLEHTWNERFPRGAMDLVALDRLLASQIPSSVQTNEPSQGKRLLTFADSRQGAARLAPRLAFTHRILLVRRWVMETLRSLPGAPLPQTNLQAQLNGLRNANVGGLMDDLIAQLEAQLASSQGGVALPDLVRAMVHDVPRLERWAKSLEGSRFQERFRGKNVLTAIDPGRAQDLETAWYGLIRSSVGREALAALGEGRSAADSLPRALQDYLSEEINLAVLREICRPAGRTPTAKRLGLVQMNWPTITSNLPPLSVLGIPEGLHQELFERACNMLLEQRCVLLPHPFNGREEDWGRAFINRRAVLQESNTAEAFSFASDRVGTRRFASFLHLLAEACQRPSDDVAWAKHIYVALWESLRMMAPAMPVLELFQVDGIDSLRLKAEALQVRYGTQGYLCERCGALSAWGGLGRCAEQRFREARGGERAIPCSGTLIAVDPSQELSPGLDAFPHARQLLLRHPPSEGLAAFEHTAQRKGDNVRRDELLFRKCRMNVLCSSTTLEMGIDLPDLDSVVLMGVPPAASNHTQRVGRAGRTRRQSCLALTLAGDDSFDRWAHRDLGAFLQRPGITPRVDLDREEKARQHFFAWRLSLLVRERNLQKVGSGAQLLAKVAAFAGIDPNLRRSSIETWNARFPNQAWVREDCAPGWGDEAVLCWEELTEPQRVRAKRLFDREEPTLLQWLQDGRQALEDELRRIRGQVAAIEDALGKASDRKTGFLRYLLDSLRDYGALDWLAENHLLPRFGFPISNVSLDHPANLGQAEPIERDRRQAILEWTPGASVVVANRSWTVRGLKPDARRGQMETHHRLYTLVTCRRCSHQHVVRSTELGDCPICGSRERELLAIAVPYAFASEDTSQLAGMGTELPASRTSHILTLDDRQWPEGLFAFRAAVHVAFLNLGTNGAGYWLCRGCGRLRRVIPNGAWIPCCSKDSATAPESVALGEVVRMDVLRIRPKNTLTFEGLRALAQALRLAASFLLEMDPRSLAIADLPEDGLNTLYMVDLTDGGSGLLARLQEPERLQQWLERAQQILSHVHHPDQPCVNACPGCLLTHDNRAEHRHRPFRRMDGLEALSRLLEEAALVREAPNSRLPSA